MLPSCSSTHIFWFFWLHSFVYLISFFTHFVGSFRCFQPGIKLCLYSESFLRVDSRSHETICGSRACGHIAMRPAGSPLGQSRFSEEGQVDRGQVDREGARGVAWGCVSLGCAVPGFEVQLLLL